MFLIKGFIYSIYLFSLLTGMGLNELYTTKMPYYFLLWPFFSFCNIIYNINRYVNNDQRVKVKRFY